METSPYKYYGSVHTFTAPSRDGTEHTQLWTMLAVPGKETEYYIRNLATGCYLDIWTANFQSGTQIVGHPASSGPHQVWQVFHSRQGDSYVAPRLPASCD